MSGMELKVPEYPKIQSIFKRDEKTHKFILGDYSLPEFEYLKDNVWVFTEKVDGTNVRCIYDGKDVYFRGRTDRAQLPTFLYDRLRELFSAEKLKEVFPSVGKDENAEWVCLYGEGYGNRIQAAGKNYIPGGVDFVLFDVRIGRWWLKREDVEEIADSLDIGAVPIVGEGTLSDAVDMVKAGFTSRWSTADNVFLAEGLVLRPKVDLFARNGSRIITKLKTRDF